MRSSHERDYLRARGKSYLAAELLAFFFGPLGLLYCAPVAGIALTVIAVLLGFTVFVPLGIWALSLVWAPFAVANENRKRAIEARLIFGTRRKKSFEKS